MSKITLILLFLFANLLLANDPKYDFAKSYLENGQYEDAARLFKDLYEQNPDKVEYFSGLIESYRKIGKHKELIPVINRKLDKEYHYVLDALLAEMYYKVGEKEKAILQWKQIIEKDKDNLQVYGVVSDALTSNREFEEAVEVLKKAKSKLSRKKIHTSIS